MWIFQIYFMRPSSSNTVIAYSPLLLYLISHFSEFEKIFKIAQFQVLSFIAFAQSLCFEMFQMSTGNFQMYTGWHKLDNSQDVGRGTLWAFPPLAALEVTFLHSSLLSRFSFVFMWNTSRDCGGRVQICSGAFVLTT